MKSVRNIGKMEIGAGDESDSSKDEEMVDMSKSSNRDRLGSLRFDVNDIATWPSLSSLRKSVIKENIVEYPEHSLLTYQWLRDLLDIKWIDIYKKYLERPVYTNVVKYSLFVAAIQRTEATVLEFNKVYCDILEQRKLSAKVMFCFL